MVAVSVMWRVGSRPEKTPPKRGLFPAIQFVNGRIGMTSCYFAYALALRAGRVCIAFVALDNPVCTVPMSHDKQQKSQRFKSLIGAQGRNRTGTTPFGIGGF
jgi:hypothetical protein